MNVTHTTSASINITSKLVAHKPVDSVKAKKGSRALAQPGWSGQYETSVRLTNHTAAAIMKILDLCKSKPELSHLNKRKLMNLSIFHVSKLGKGQLALLESSTQDFGKKTHATPLRMSNRLHLQHAKPCLKQLREATGRSKIGLTHILTKGVLSLGNLAEDEPIKLFQVLTNLQAEQFKWGLECC